MKIKIATFRYVDHRYTSQAMNDWITEKEIEKSDVINVIVDKDGYMLVYWGE